MVKEQTRTCHRRPRQRSGKEMIRLHAARSARASFEPLFEHVEPTP